MTSTHDFPTAGVELRHLLVVSDYTRALSFYRDVLGATVVREFPGTLCFLSFGGSQILLTVPGGPTQDKPTVTFAPPADADRVSSELAIKVRIALPLTRCCALAEPSSSLSRWTGAMRCEPSSAIPMVISWSSPRPVSRRVRLVNSPERVCQRSKWCCRRGRGLGPPLERA
jgi:Glyoxalase/Bleomycin resistance protein/Dioxygenase superfamily